MGEARPNKMAVIIETSRSSVLGQFLFLSFVNNFANELQSGSFFAADVKLGGCPGRDTVGRDIAQGGICQCQEKPTFTESRRRYNSK